MKRESTLQGNSGSNATQLSAEIQTPDMMRLLVDSVRDYSILFLDPEGRVLTWNPTAERLKMWTASEIIGEHFSRFYTAQDVERGKPQMELEMAAKTGRYEDEGWRLRKDGTRFWANVIITALRDSNGKLRGFGKVTRDMTERKAMEDKLKKQSQEIMEMATVPIVQVWEGVVLVPLIGTLDSQRTQQLMERLLDRIAETSSPVAVLDITGVPTVDTQTAQHLIEMTSAVRLLGSEVILTGVRPIIAQTLVHLGIDLSSVITRGSLAAGLRMALDSLNLQVTSKAKVL
jgi:PAS domain S-box-containing protein